MIKVTTNSTGVLYSIRTNPDSDEGMITIECGDDHTLKVKGPKEIMSKAIGGRGDEDEKEAWFQDKDVKSPSEAVSNVLEILKAVLGSPEDQLAAFYVTSKKEKTKV